MSSSLSGGFALRPLGWSSYCARCHPDLDVFAFSERGFYRRVGSPVLVQVLVSGVAFCDRAIDVVSVENGALAQLSDRSWAHSRRVRFCSGTDGRCVCSADDFCSTPAVSVRRSSPAPEVPVVQPQSGRVTVQLLVEHRKGTPRQFDRWSTFTVPADRLDAWKQGARDAGKRFRVVSGSEVAA